MDEIHIHSGLISRWPLLPTSLYDPTVDWAFRRNVLCQRWKCARQTNATYRADTETQTPWFFFRNVALKSARKVILDVEKINVPPPPRSYYIYSGPLQLNQPTVVTWLPRDRASSRWPWDLHRWYLIIALAPQTPSVLPDCGSRV